MFMNLNYHNSTAWQVQIGVQLTPRSLGETHNATKTGDVGTENARHVKDVKTI